MKKFTLGEEAKEQLAAMGVSEKSVRRQFEILSSPPPVVRLDRPCVVGDGITALPAGRMRFYSDLYENCAEVAPVAFIPASGAASRMFAPLVSGDRKSLERFARDIKKFAFFDDLKIASAERRLGDIEALAASRNFAEIAKLVLSPEGLGYGDIPKGLVKIHRCGKISKTAFEEHIDFAGEYARASDGVCRIHFTVSEKFSAAVSRHLESAARRSQNADVSFSVQNPKTDTIALDLAGKIVCDRAGKIIFRPAGHGALLENLGRTGADAVFISNIDNVPRTAGPSHALSRKALAGLLLETRGKICAFMSECDKSSPDEKIVSEAAALCEQFGFSQAESGIYSQEFFAFIKRSLNRPLRVCGVVKNSAEPGGGPFWAKDKFGRISPQIVEPVQANSADAREREVWNLSTHFNPVDIVCSIKNCSGEKFNLRDFSDDGFMIAEKNVAGAAAKTLEAPGLWNGAMAGWNTIFAEIPLADFNPVKTVFDLLRDCHQDLPL